MKKPFFYLRILSFNIFTNKGVFMNKIFTFLLLSTAYLSAGQGITNADDYQKNSSLQWNWAMDSLKYISFEEFDQVLDVGSGDGKITAHIADSIPNGKVVGMDISAEMVEKASQYSSDKLSFIQGSATDIPFENQFDKIVSFNTLHWVKDQSKALLAMKGALKPFGTMLLTMPAKGPNNVFTVAETVATSDKWAPYFPTLSSERVYYTVEEYATLIEDASLRIELIEQTDNSTIYANKFGLFMWLKPLINFIDHLDPALQLEFVQDVTTQFIHNNPPNEDGSITITHQKLLVIASKPL